ncbi:MAG: 50S ribosomal protein L34e [Nanoarchaeota archaeon]|nr:50S ribosomal protein L34e [Nanoarchaeota archaeon]MBU1135201.1 50S ribosomal protein L34e [Nanoarchaeota archaeon]MBU2519774.1 50S ribosomal protein L34e [Nanoarchaeota archaeon]
MPRPRLRTNFLKKIRKKLPGGGYVIHYKKRNPSLPSCAECGKSLQGVAKGRFNKIKNAAKSIKKPTRKYGGNLCANCTKKNISQNVFKS